METDLRRILTRLDEAEAANRRMAKGNTHLKYATISLAILILFILVGSTPRLWAQDKQKANNAELRFRFGSTLEINRVDLRALTLVDAQGDICAAMHSPTGKPAFLLMNGDGIPVMMILRRGDMEPAIVFYDRDGHDPYELRVNRDGEPKLELRKFQDVPGPIKPEPVPPGFPIPEGNKPKEGK